MLGPKRAITWLGPFGRAYCHGAHQSQLPASRHQTLYCDVYQLHRLPSWSRCKDPMAELLPKEILASIKEHIRFQQPPKQQAEQQMQWPAEYLRPDPPTAFTTNNQKAYEDMMALARESQQWAFAMATIMKEERGHSTSCQCPTNHQCSVSHRRFRSSGQWEESLHHGGTEDITRGVPGDFMPKRYHKGRMDLVTQLHQMETSGDIHQRKGTSPRNDKGNPRDRVKEH